MAVVMFMGSMNASKMDNKSYELEAASCFEQGHYYAQWWGSVTGATAIQRVQMTLLYAELCEQEKANRFNQQA